MKRTLAGIAAIALFASNAAIAAPGVGPGSSMTGVSPSPGPIFTVADCATGFTKSGASPTGWECHTGTIVCPKPPAGMTQIAEPPKAQVIGAGVKFTYYCAYGVPPK